MMVRKDQSGAVSQETVARPSEGISAHVEGQAKVYEWREWMRVWGAACEALYLPTQLMNQLRTIKPTMGVGFESELDIDTASGVQLDLLGKILGLNRIITGIVLLDGHSKI